MLAAYALLWFGLLLTVTRLTIATCIVQVVALLVLWRRPAPLLVLAAAGTVVAGVLLAIVPGLGGFVWETLMWQTASSGSHATDYYRGLVSLVERPLGAGIGTADATAARLGRIPITSDNQFLKYGVELGAVAMFALVGWIASVIWAALRTAIERPDGARGSFCAFAGVAALGFALNGMTAVLTNSPTITYLFFWIAGTAVAVASAPATTTAAAPVPHDG